MTSTKRYEPTAVRGFTTSRPREVLERVLSARPVAVRIEHPAVNIYVLTGAPRRAQTRAVERVAHGDPWDERNTDVPAALKFRTRAPIRLRQGRYSALACARDWEARSVRPSQLNCFARPPPCLFCGPRPGLAMGGSGDVSTDRHAAAGAEGCTVARRWRGRRFADRRGIVSRASSSFSVHVIGTRPHLELHPYARRARRDGHVRRGHSDASSAAAGVCKSRS